MPPLSVPLAAIRQAAFFYGPDLTIIDTNDRAEELAGRSLVGCSAEDVARVFQARSADGTPVGPAELRSSRALAGEDVLDVPLSVTAADGRTLDVLATASPVRDGDAITGALVVWQDITERNRTGEAEARLRALMDHNPCLVFLKDEAGRYVYLNETYRERFVHSADWAGKTDHDFWPAESAALFLANDAEVLRSGRTHQFLEDSTDLDGTRYVWLNYKFPFTDAQGRQYVGGIGIDATARVRAEEAMRRSEEQYRGIVETAEEGIAVHAPDGTITFINQRMADMLGYTPDEIIGRLSLDFVDDEERRDVIAARDTLWRDGNAGRELKLRRKDGSVLWTLVNVTVRRDNAGSIIGYLGMHTDITERKRTEASLRESEERFRLTLRNAPTAIFHQDTDLRYTWYSNPHPPFSNADLLGKTDADLMAPEDAARIMALKQEVLATGESRRREVSVTADGATTYYDLAVEPKIDTQGRTVGVMGVSHDITERKNMDEALRRSEADLAEAQRVTKTGSWSFDIQSGRIHWSDELYRIFDIEKTDFGGTYESFLSRVHPDDRASVLLANAEARERGIPFEIDYRILARTGAQKIVHETGYAVKDTEGKVVRLFGTAQDITKRRRMEKLLRDSEQQLRLAAQAAGMYAWELDVATGEITFSGNVRGVVGFSYTEDDDVFSRIERYVVPEDASRHQEALRRTMEGEGDLHAENRVVNPETGEIVWLETHATLVRAGDGSPQRVVGVARNITERKRAEEALKRREAERAFLLQLSDALRPPADAGAIQASASRVLGEHLGASRVLYGEIAADGEGITVGQGYAEGAGEWSCSRSALEFSADLLAELRAGRIVLVPDTAGDRVPAEARAAFAAAGVGSLAAVPLVKEGRLAAALLVQQAAPRDWTPAEVSAIEQTAERTWNAVERARAEAAVRASMYNRSLIEASLDPLVTITPEGTIADVNEATIRATGRSREELIGTDFSMYFTEPEKAKAGYEAVFRTGSVHDYPLELRHRDGSVISVLYNATLYRDETGAVAGVFAAARNVTEQRRAEEALQTAYRELDDRVREQTADLVEANRELATKSRQLEQSNEELQRFAYVASHDLQEPLRSVVSFSQLLERRYRGTLDSDADEYIDFIVEGGVRMQRLIRDLLQFSRIETQGQQPVAIEPGRVVADALAVLSGQLREIGATVEVGEFPAVKADPGQLEQVLVNLVGNAVKYRRPDVPLQVRISAERMDGMVEFAVIDNGIGIEAEYFDRIFEMFRRLHTHDQYEGTGIGLAVVKRIIERHGGRVRVESTPGEGSTFFFTLPAAGETN